MLECMKNRRSIRKYTDQDIPESLLNELLEVATRASNTGNMQLYSVVVTRDPANKEKLAPAHFNQPMITGAPVVLTFCADANRFVKWAECRKAEAGFDNLQTFIASTIDAMLFAQSFCNAAEEKGLGICYLGTTAYNADQIIEALSLPRLVVPIVTVTVGYPAEPPMQNLSNIFPNTWSVVTSPTISERWKIHSLKSWEMKSPERLADKPSWTRWMDSRAWVRAS